ncbi:MAG TPA: LuxR C-terminal-related transcriptional regulator [Planctomycetota bacterium]
MDLQPDYPADGRQQRRGAFVVAALFAAVAALAAADLVSDFGEGTSAGHVAVEGAVVFAGLVGFVLVLRRILDLARREAAARREASELGSRLAAVRQEAERWRTEAKDLLQGLGAAIERQLVRWGLTAAEKEIGLLLLKGLSHKQVADARGVGEATVRQQARGIYKKAGVDGRHDLAAFFLEGLLGHAAPED